jgi:hypothetical protein
MTSEASAAGSIPAGNGLVPGSLNIVVPLQNGGVAAITSDSANNLIYKDQTVGSVTESGTWNFTLPVTANASEGDAITLGYQYYSNTGDSGGGTDSNDDNNNNSNDSNFQPSNAVYLSFLKVTQQGNKLTMISDSGVVYKGQLTGASTSKDGYVAAQQVRLSFEVSEPKGLKITGHFSGVWSGAADKNYGVLSERTIQGTHSRAGNFVGAAADTTIRVPDITISEVGESSIGE